jgi:hypothetical protein
MSNVPQDPQRLREHVLGVVTALSTYDASDSAAFADLHRRLESLTSEAEGAGLDELAPLCRIALRTTELLRRDDRKDSDLALELIESMVRHVSKSIEDSRSEQERREQAKQRVQERVGNEPEPHCAVQHNKVMLSNKLPNRGLQLASAKKLGELMVQLSMLTPAQVEAALAEQRISGCRFGEALIQLRMLPREAVENAIRAQRSRAGWAQDNWDQRK